ncbi:MAG TPA: hypothetical protein VF043_02845 [Ktedonobacteraceae bacterium]
MSTAVLEHETVTVPVENVGRALSSADSPAMQSRSITIALLFLIGCVTLIMTGFAIIMPVFPQRLQALGQGPETLALMEGTFGLGMFLFSTPMGDLAWDAGHIPCCGRWQPPRFCQQCRRRAFAHPRLVLLAAFSRPLSRCYPLSYRLPRLHLYCAEGTSRAQRTICVLPWLYWLRG